MVIYEFILIKRVDFKNGIKLLNLFMYVYICTVIVIL